MLIDLIGRLLNIQMSSRPATTNQQTINPYLRVYRELNVSIDKGLTKQVAELVSAQIAFLHNAMGFVIKDMIRILSLKFSQQPSQTPPTQIQTTKPVVEQLKPLTRQISQFMSQSKNCPTLPKLPPTAISPNIRQQIEDIDSSQKKPLQKPASTELLKQPIKRTFEPEPEEKKKRVSCNKCEKFYEAAGIEGSELCQCSSRHRRSKPATKIPSFSQYFQI